MQKYISIIIPVYNRIEELKRAIQSVLNQTYKYFELIIVDDGSEYDIRNIVNKFSDNRIKYLRNDENKGVSYSRNKGIKSSNFNLIAFLDSDDEWIKTKLEEQIKYLNNNPNIRLVHTDEIWIKNGKKINQKKRHKKSGGDIFIRSLELCLISPSSVLLKKDLFNDYGYFDENLIVCEDYDLWLRITAFEEIGFIDKKLVIKYGGHSDQLSKKYSAMDKYRVQSLLKLLDNNKIDKNKKNELIKMIIVKSNILKNGALKRSKYEEYLYYNNIIENLKQNYNINL